MTATTTTAIPTNNMQNALVLTAAGNSTRMGGGVKKEYLPLLSSSDGTVSVLSSALHAFLSTSFFKFIVITLPFNGEQEARLILAADLRIKSYLHSPDITLLFTEGGSTRQDSVKKGLETLASRTGVPEHTKIGTVLIHDGARPWVKAETISAVLEGVRLHGASVPAVESVDTQKETDLNGKIIRHLDRTRISSVQTPQGFLFEPLLEAHRKAEKDGRTYTDDTEIWGRYAGDVYICAGDRGNRKVTFQGDI